MKRFKLFLLSAILCAGTLTTCVSCGDDEDDNPAPVDNGKETPSGTNDSKPNPINDTDPIDNPENPQTTTFTVTFDSDGGSTVDPKIVDANAKVAKPDDPTKDGFTFVAWNLLDFPYDFDSPVTEDITLKAIWKEVEIPSFMVTFDTDGGSAVEAVFVDENTKVAKPDDPSKDGFTFVGWYLGDAAYDFDAAVTDNFTLKAMWKEIVVDVTGITINADNFTLPMGVCKTIVATVAPDNATDKTVVWTSDNEEVAVVNENGVVMALATGDATITATSGGKSAQCTVNVIDYVDLGLPSGTIWAAYNVGATSGIGFGDYFCRGETFVKDNYDWDYYTFRYKELPSPLTSSYDAATVNMGADWRIPTYAECDELKELCHWIWTLDYNGTGIAGHLVYYNSEDNYMFVPAAGYKASTSVCDANWHTSFWSSEARYGAWILTCNASDDDVNWDENDQVQIGHTVRAVRKK